MGYIMRTRHIDIFTILILLFFGCGQTVSKKTIKVSDTDSMTPNTLSNKNMVSDSLTSVKVIDKSFHQRNFIKIDLDEKIGGKTLRQYLADDKIPNVFKTVFQGERALNDDEETLALIDSLFSKDSERHPFYFVLATRTMWWSDGAFSEPLGEKAKKYVETETKQFLKYFETEKVLTESDFNKWTEYVAGEIGITDENNELQEAENVRKRMMESYSDCTLAEQKEIDRFIEKVMKYNP